MVEVQQSHNSMNCGAALRLKEQPWCGKHISNQEPITAKNVYNYALKNWNVEKTPMCRVAELTRYHKIKHEYVLLDESGPAHKKQFTVKLVLKPGEEYEGNGPSIKKAQQSAAENALLRTTLQIPPRKPVKSKNETNPVWLLYNVANQLGLTVRFEEQVEMMPLRSTPFMQPPLSFPANDRNRLFLTNNIPSTPCNSMPSSINGYNKFAPPPNGKNGLPVNLPNLTLPPSANTGQEQKSEIREFQNRSVIKPDLVCPSWNPMMGPKPNYLNSYQQPIRRPPLVNCMPNSFPLMARPPPLTKLNTPPPLIPFNMNLASQPSIFKCVFLLSDGSEHRGEGRTMISAKVDAALNALFHLRPQLSQMEAKLKDEQRPSLEFDNKQSEPFESQMLKQSKENLVSESEDDEEVDENRICTVVCDDGKSPSVDSESMKKRRSKPKSVVSQIHECAYRMKMNVEFEVIKESGEPHNRRYVLRCSLSSPQSQQTPIVAFGEGSSKKAAKQNACQLMLEKIKGLDSDALYLAHVIVKQASKKTPASALSAKDNKRKTIIKDMKKDPQYGQHINPISRLIQVMQSRKEPEPMFRLIGEHGQNRYREFVVQVTCMNITMTGVGPNKKLAKRAAAVAMLEEIGYIKPMPQPGKSLLKKKGGDPIQNQVEFWVFDPNDLSNSQPPAQSLSSPVFDKTQTFAGNSCPTFESHALETFADVESTMVKEVSQLRFSSESTSPTMAAEPIRAPCDGEKQEDAQPARSQRRRVTFSNQVSSCPPPEDVNYPDATIAPLKSEVVLVTKLKKRGRDSKKALTSEEKLQIASICHLFCQFPNGKELRSGYLANDVAVPMSPDNEFLEFPGQPSAMSPIQSSSTAIAEFQPGSTPTKLQHSLAVATPVIANTPLLIDLMSPSQLPLDLIVCDAKVCLERLAKQYRFTVSYSDFPKAMDEYFSLVTLGLDKPILCHGCGVSEEQAHNDAAYNAILHLSSIDTSKPAVI